MALNLDSDGNGLGVADLAALLGAGNRGNGGFGGDGIYGLITLLVALSFFGGGFGGFGGGGIMPWLMMLMMGNNSPSTVVVPASGGFGGPGNSSCERCTDAIQRTADHGATITAITGVGNDVTSGFANAEIAAGARQLASVQQSNNNMLSLLQQLFGMTTTFNGQFSDLSAAFAKCCCDNQLATQDVKYTVANDGAQTRLAVADGVQKVMDKLCALELDGYKDKLTAALARINTLENAQSQTAQNNYIQSALITLAQYIRPPINPAFIVNPPYSTPTTDAGTTTTAA